MQQTSTTVAVTRRLRQQPSGRNCQPSRVCRSQQLPLYKHSPLQVSRSQNNLARQQPARGCQLRRPQQQPQPLRAALSQYNFTRHPGWLLDWFQQAVRNIVRHLGKAPFLELVQLPADGGSQQCPQLTIQPVVESAVPLPQLWRRIAEGLSGSSPDVLILVQQVPTQSEGGGAAAAEAAAAAAAAAGQATATGVLCALLLACTSPADNLQEPSFGNASQPTSDLEPDSGGSSGGRSSSRRSGHGRHSRGSGQEHGSGGSSSGSDKGVPEMKGRLACELLMQYHLGAADAVLAGGGAGSQNNSSMTVSCGAHSESNSTAAARQLAAQLEPVNAALVPSQQAQQAVSPLDRNTRSSLGIQPRRVSDAAAQQLLPTRPLNWQSRNPAAGTAAAACSPATVGSCIEGEAGTGWYGLVVQSEQQTGAEGCYLLKVVQSSCPASVAPCVHFSLTKVSEGAHLEQQFVNAWLQ